MGLLSFLRKNKQESRSDSTFQSRAEEDSDAVRSRAKRGKTGKERSRASDPVLPEKKRARRRLVGAVALVLAAVVGLPMILDSEPKPVTDDIAIDIPSKDKRTHAGAVQTPPPVASAPKLPSNAGLDKDEEVIDPASLPTQSEAAPSTAARSEMPQLVKPEPKPRAEPRAETPRPPKPEGKNEAKPERKTELAHAKPEAKPAPHAVEKADEASRAKAILEGRAEPKPETKKDSGRFVVQVAALATQDKVDELQDKLRSAGIASFTQKVSTDGGSRTRIRVGPFSSKEEADRVRAKLSKIGLAGTLVPA
jgi:DedD protein